MAVNNNGFNRSCKGRTGCSSIQIIVLALVTTAIGLFVTAFHLNLQLAYQPSNVVLLSPNTIEKGEKKSNAPVKKKSRAAVNPYEPWQPIIYDPATTAGVLRNNGAYKHNRIYCMIPFVWRKDFYDIIMATWGKRCDQIYFFADAIVNLDGKIVRDAITGDLESSRPYWEYPKGTFPDNVIFMNMTRSWDGCTDKKTGKPTICRHIWEKMWRSWIYVDENHADRAEWFCKVDYDTFLFPENLQYYVQDFKKWNAKEEHHYFGHKLYNPPIDAKNEDRHYFENMLYHPPIIAGACVCWSHKTLTAIAEVYRTMPKGYTGEERNKCEDRAGEGEELTTSKCLKLELGVEPEEAIDDNRRDFVMLDQYENHLDWNRTKQGEWWFWNGKEKERGQMEECCANRPIAIHKYKFPGEHRRLEAQFYGPEKNADYKRLKPINKRYVDKVRKAMNIQP